MTFWLESSLDLCSDVAHNRSWEESEENQGMTLLCILWKSSAKQAVSGAAILNASKELSVSAGYAQRTKGTSQRPLRTSEDPPPL